MTNDTIHLTDHFALFEFDLDDLALTNSGVTDALDIQRMRGAARILCHEILEPVRAKFGPLKIDSGFRDVTHNYMAGGKAKSYHLYQQGHAAADFLPYSASLSEVFDWLRLESGLAFDKIILECRPADGNLLVQFAQLLNGVRGGQPPMSSADALVAVKWLTPRCLHVQTDVDAAPRRLAYAGFTGDAATYFPVPVLKEVMPDAT